MRVVLLSAFLFDLIYKVFFSEKWQFLEHYLIVLTLNTWKFYMIIEYIGTFDP